MRRWLTQFMIDQLTKPLGRYERRGWNDMEALQRHVHKGDVVLVEGEQRISAIIRYLTQSSWSHAAIYVGDELLLRGEILPLFTKGQDGMTRIFTNRIESMHTFLARLLTGLFMKVHRLLSQLRHIA